MTHTFDLKALEEYRRQLYDFLIKDYPDTKIAAHFNRIRQENPPPEQPQPITGQLCPPPAQPVDATCPIKRLFDTKRRAERRAIQESMSQNNIQPAAYFAVRYLEGGGYLEAVTLDQLCEEVKEIQAHRQFEIFPADPGMVLEQLKHALAENLIHRTTLADGRPTIQATDKGIEIESRVRFGAYGPLAWHRYDRDEKLNPHTVRITGTDKLAVLRQLHTYTTQRSHRCFNLGRFYRTDLRFGRRVVKGVGVQFRIGDIRQWTEESYIQFFRDIYMQAGVIDVTKPPLYWWYSDPVQVGMESFDDASQTYSARFKWV